MTVCLLIFLIASLLQIREHWYSIIASLADLAVIIILNKYYFSTYSSFPADICADNEKIICSGFLLNRNKIVIMMANIDRITGGIIDGFPTRPVYIHDSKLDLTIGFYMHVNNFRNLLSTILKNIPEELYIGLLAKLKEKKV